MTKEKQKAEFVINKKGEIDFSRVSTTHGGRATNEEIFEAMGKL